MLRGALIGCGYIAPRHTSAWSAVPNGELVAVCDLDLTRARELAESAGIGAAFSSFDELMSSIGSELDFIDISVPPALHRALVEQGLAHNLHVLCQKPMAESREDTLAIVQMAEDSTKVVAINEMWKWIPAYEQVWNYLRAGTVGDIEAVRFTGLSNLLLPRRTESTMAELVDKPSEGARRVLLDRFGVMPELIIMEYGVHLLDSVRTWFGEPVSLSASTSRVNPEVIGDDAASIRLTFDGFDADVWIDWSSPSAETGDVIDGEALAIRGSAVLLTVTSGKLFEWHPRSGPAVTHYYPQDTRDAGFARSHANFAECAEGGDRPASHPADNLRSQSLMLASYASAADGGVPIANPSKFVTS